MRVWLIYIVAISAMLGFWFLSEEPTVDALVFGASTLLSVCAAVFMFLKRSLFGGFAVVACGVSVFLFFRIATIESVAAAELEFHSMANAEKFCELNSALVRGHPAWIENRDGIFSLYVGRFGASNKLLFRAKGEIPELRLVSIVGEQKMFRMRLGDCPAAR